MFQVPPNIRPRRHLSVPLSQLCLCYNLLHLLLPLLFLLLHLLLIPFPFTTSAFSTRSPLLFFFLQPPGLFLHALLSFPPPPSSLSSLLLFFLYLLPILLSPLPSPNSLFLLLPIFSSSFSSRFSSSYSSSPPFCLSLNIHLLIFSSSYSTSSSEPWVPLRSESHPCPDVTWGELTPPLASVLSAAIC